MSASIDRLPEMLTRLSLKAMRERLDTLLDEAARRELSLRETLALLCEAEVAHREERRIQMGMGIAKFPFVRTLDGFDFEAQPSLDPRQVRDLASCRWVAGGDALLLLGPPGVGKTHLAVMGWTAPTPAPVWQAEGGNNLFEGAVHHGDQDRRSRHCEACLSGPRR